MAFDRFSTVLPERATILLVGLPAPSRFRVGDLLGNDRVSVLDADDPQAAVALITEQPVDLVILDERTCGSAAYDFCRTSAVEGGPSILMLSASDDVVSQIVALEVGADEVLPAAVDDRLLAAQVRARLRRTRRPAASPSPRGGWSVDPETRVAMGPNGGRVELARHQVRLMQVFLAHPGEVITAERLAEQVPDMHLEPAAFRTAMSRLRRRLAPLDSREFLRIVRGRGYVHLPG